MSDPTYPLFPVFSFLAFVLVLLPLPWHLQAWNAGTCLYMIWTGLACLNQFINSIVWHNNALNPSPIWCDISSRLIVGSAVAIPAASLCINRRLYKIATLQSTSISRAQKRRAVIEDIAIGAGIPILEMAFQYIVNGHRFNIFGDIGCFPATINVWLAYVFVGAWPIVIGLVSAVYCVLSLRSFIRRQAQFNELLAKTTSLTKNRYFRLMALATTELCCTIPLASYTIYLNLTAEPVSPYRGWADLHFGYSRVDQIPSTLWRLNSKTIVSLEMGRWLVVVCALLFFAFFGFAEEARRQYKAAFAMFAKKIGIRLEAPRFLNRKPALLSSEKKLTNSGGILPVFVARPKKAFPRDSFLSTLPSESCEKFVTSPFDSTASTRISSSTTTLTLPPLSKSVSKDLESPYSECYGHAY